MSELSNSRTLPAIEQDIEANWSEIIEARAAAHDHAIAADNAFKRIKSGDHPLRVQRGAAGTTPGVDSRSVVGRRIPGPAA
jgi:hypothetical protein